VMMITQAEITRTINKYLDRYPDEVEELEPLRATVEKRNDFWSRSVFPLHVTCSAAVVNDLDQVLTIKHRALDKWLLPGGHIECADLNIISASLQELKEETSIGQLLAASPMGYDTIPLDIDIHDIPVNPAKKEPAHRHADLRYLFRAVRAEVDIQPEEVSDYAWRAPA